MRFSILLAAAVILSAAFIFSQDNKNVRMPKIAITGDEQGNVLKLVDSKNNSIKFNQVVGREFVYNIVGTGVFTGYDLQSNGTPQQIWQSPVNPALVHMVFSKSEQVTGWSDRNASYLFSSNMGSSWSNVGNIASQRAGFPTISGLNNGVPVAALHTSEGSIPGNRTKIYIRNTAGTAWTNYLPSSSTNGDPIWPRCLGIGTNDVAIISSVNGAPYDEFVTNSLDIGTSTFSGWNGISGDQAETHNIAKSANEQIIGLAYTGATTDSLTFGNMYYRESSDRGVTWSDPVQIYQYDFSGDSLGAMRGVDIIFLNSIPYVVFELIKQDYGASTYFPSSPSKIILWSPAINGGNAIVLADSNNIPYFENANASNDVMAPICRPSIGKSSNEQALFVAINASTADQLVGTPFNEANTYYAGYLMYSTDAGVTWSVPEKFTPPAPLRDWRYISLNPVNYVDPANKAHVLIAAQADTIPGSNINAPIGYPASVSAELVFVSTEVQLSAQGTFLTVSTPNGGENWAAGSSHNITWVSNGVTNVKIDYTTNLGNTWINISSSTPSDGSYSWSVPNTPSSNCKIKITDVTTSSVTDQSDSPFNISVNSAITVNSPNGGESWQINAVRNIMWTASNAANVKIEYSTNNGTDWIVIINSTPADGVYEWTVPNTPSTESRVKISDASNAGVHDESDAAFSIVEVGFYALIDADPFWIDEDYDGLDLGIVDGSGSHITQGSIINYEWYVNGQLVNNSVNPIIELKTGTSMVKLIVYSSTGATASDSVNISTYSAKLSTGGAILSGISQYGNSFYVTSMNNGVYKIDSTGTILQSYTTGGSIQSSFCISNLTGLMYVGSSDTRLYCFDGSLNSIWDKGLGGVVSNAASLNYAGDVIYAGANDNTTQLGLLKSLMASNGNPRWTFQADGNILSSPVVLEILDSNNVVIRTIIYFGTTKGTVYAVEDIGNAYDVFWSASADPDSAIVSSPAVSIDGMIYIGSRNGYLYRFTWDGLYQSGWKRYTGGSIVSSPVIDENEIVYIASGNGYVQGFPKDFTFNSDPVKVFYHNTGINGTAAIGPDGTLLVGDTNGKFFALDKNASGTNMPVKWYFQSSGPILSPTLVTNNGMVYIGSASGDVFIMRDPGVGYKEFVTDYEWPTFKGNNQRSKVVRLNTLITSVKNPDQLPSAYNLYQNYPNPFNPSTSIKYEIPKSGFVSIKVYDILGKEITQLVNEETKAGVYELTFDASGIPSGIYFYRMQAGDYTETKKLTVIK